MLRERIEVFLSDHRPKRTTGAGAAACEKLEDRSADLIWSRGLMQEWSPSSQDGQKALVVFAHPDDADFYCGGTIARLIEAGVQVFYLCASRGNKGGSDNVDNAEQISRVRTAEQIAAAQALGVPSSNVNFLDLDDGTITYGRDLIDRIVREIRIIRPNIVITLDTNIFDPTWGINHADHRAVALATVDAVYPFARNKNEMPDLPAHEVQTLLVLNYQNPNCFIDISGPAFEAKKTALSAHQSQFGDATDVIKKAEEIGRQETFIRVTW